MCFLLPELLESFIDTYQSEHGINFFHSYSAPSFTWKLGSKGARVELQFLIDNKLRFAL